MIRFECDYSEGAHRSVMDLLLKTNEEQTCGYGLDDYCDEARTIIKKICKREDIDVHFLVGGTQANTTVIASALRPYQGVLCASTGHINVHETGAIEATGHKVMPLASDDGKITATQVRDAYEEHFNMSGREHEVQPGMVYISFPTENGTIYSRKEIEDIYKVCRECGLWLFIDGARLGYGITSEKNDITMEDLAKNCDVFYIGGTKVGALFGEAIVISNDALKNDFRYSIKQRGGMLAKGRLLGLQFKALLEDGVYFEIAQHANEMAYKIRDAIKAKGYSFLFESYTNQQFPIFEDDILRKLEEKYVFNFWEKVDDTHTAVRICTSWATTQEQVDQLIEDINRL